MNLRFARVERHQAGLGAGVAAVDERHQLWGLIRCGQLRALVHPVVVGQRGMVIDQVEVDAGNAA
jgi:hypothetical protein